MLSCQHANAALGCPGNLGTRAVRTGHHQSPPCTALLIIPAFLGSALGSVSAGSKETAARLTPAESCSQHPRSRERALAQAGCSPSTHPDLLSQQQAAMGYGRSLPSAHNKLNPAHCLLLTQPPTAFTLSLSEHIWVLGSLKEHTDSKKPC